MLLLHVSLLLKLTLHILLASEVIGPPLAFTLSVCSESRLSSHCVRQSCPFYSQTFYCLAVTVSCSWLSRRQVDKPDAGKETLLVVSTSQTQVSADGMTTGTSALVHTGVLRVDHSFL